MLTSSKYNHFFRKEDKSFVFNAETCAFFQVEEDMFLALKNNQIQQLSNMDIEKLLASRILIKKGEQENYYLRSKMKYNAVSNQQENMHLTIMTTSNCNFACPYCFEKEKVYKNMTMETLSKLISFVKGHKFVRKMSVTWYGGEPLLNPSIIEEFYSAINHETDIVISNSSIVTNGYLLTGNNINMLISLGVNKVQVTIDGTEDYHNKRRFLTSGEGTYKKIISNIDKLLELNKNCELSIRVNIDHTNSDQFSIIYDILANRWKGKDVYIYPGYIREDNESRTCLANHCIHSSEVVDFLISQKKKGVDINIFPKNNNDVKSCMLNCVNSYVIGAEGEIYKCWNDALDSEKIIGNIDDYNLLNKTLLYRYSASLSPFDDKECEACSILPLCDGGCKWYRYRNMYEKGKYNVCSIYKDPEKLKKAIFNIFKK